MHYNERSKERENVSNIGKVKTKTTTKLNFSWNVKTEKGTLSYWAKINNIFLHNKESLEGKKGNNIYNLCVGWVQKERNAIDSDVIIFYIIYR